MLGRVLARAALLVASTALALVTAPGCGAPEPAKPRTPVPAASASAARAAALIVKRALFMRPSELAHVTNDRADPAAQALFQAHIAQPSVSLLPTPAPPRVTAIRLDDTRRDEAPGMTPAGDVFTATLAEGQRASMPLKLAVGACQTFIAQGGLGVIEVDLFITTGDVAAGRVVAEDPETGPIAVIGGRGKCFAGTPETAVDAVLHVIVRRGAGVVLVRAYKKPGA